MAALLTLQKLLALPVYTGRMKTHFQVIKPANLEKVVLMTFEGTHNILVFPEGVAFKITKKLPLSFRAREKKRRAMEQWPHYRLQMQHLASCGCRQNLKPSLWLMYGQESHRCTSEEANQ